MTSTLQNRLVGTIIVVALVVIVLPEFLDGEKRTNNQEFVNIPPTSQLIEINDINQLDTQSIADEVNQPIEVIDEKAVDSLPASISEQNVTNEIVETVKPTNESTQTQSVNVNNTPLTTATSADTLAQEKPDDKATSNAELDKIIVKDSGWVVQLGSFRHEKNVKELLKTLNDAGYRTYSRPVITSVGELTKVFVGPELEKKTLEQALPHLQEITKLKGKITPFEVSAG